MCFGVFVQLNEERAGKGRARREMYPIGYVIQENGCWDWVGNIDPHGYGYWFIGKKNYRACRAVYERHKGAIPARLTLDHLCRNRRCVNPDHLEAVTNKVNVLRGEGPAARNARKTHCNRGHPFDAANTGPVKNGRRCRACARIADARYKKKRRAELG